MVKGAVDVYDAGIMDQDRLDVIESTLARVIQQSFIWVVGNLQ